MLRSSGGFSVAEGPACRGTWLPAATRQPRWMPYNDRVTGVLLGAHITPQQRAFLQFGAPVAGKTDLQSRLPWKYCSCRKRQIVGKGRGKISACAAGRLQIVACRCAAVGVGATARQQPAVMASLPTCRISIAAALAEVEMAAFQKPRRQKVHVHLLRCDARAAAAARGCPRDGGSSQLPGCTSAAGGEYLRRQVKAAVAVVARQIAAQRPGGSSRPPGRDHAEAQQHRRQVEQAGSQPFGSPPPTSYRKPRSYRTRRWRRPRPACRT